jgi:hypothetical protein
VTSFLSTIGLVVIAVLTVPGLVLVWLAAPVLDAIQWRIDDDHIERVSLVFWVTALATLAVERWLR